MNNYNQIEKLLHRLVLNNRRMSYILFDLEKKLFLRHKSETKNNHIFITGLARSGTTIMLRNIYSSEVFAAFKYSDMPFILAPNLWGMIQRKKRNLKLQERPHGDGIYNSFESPEAFEEIFWQSFKNEKDIDSMFKDLLALIMLRNKKSRYLSKNNLNFFRLEKLLKSFPGSKGIIIYRDPLQHANSLFNQHLNFNHIQKEDSFTKDYMDWLGHKEFGLGYEPLFKEDIQFQNFNYLNHWLEQWLKTYEYILNNYSDNHNLLFVSYEKLCTDENIWKNICKFIEIDHRYQISKFKISQKVISASYDLELLLRCKAVHKRLINL